MESGSHAHRTIVVLQGKPDTARAALRATQGVRYAHLMVCHGAPAARHHLRQRAIPSRGQLAAVACTGVQRTALAGTRTLSNAKQSEISSSQG